MKLKHFSLADETLLLFRALHHEYAGLLPDSPRQQRLGRLKYRAYRRMRRREQTERSVYGADMYTEGYDQAR